MLNLIILKDIYISQTYWLLRGGYLQFFDQNKKFKIGWEVGKKIDNLFEFSVFIDIYHVKTLTKI